MIGGPSGPVITGSQMKFHRTRDTLTRRGEGVRRHADTNFGALSKQPAQRTSLPGRQPGTSAGGLIETRHPSWTTKESRNCE